jgi:hypothetical protein
VEGQRGAAGWGRRKIPPSTVAARGAFVHLLQLWLQDGTRGCRAHPGLLHVSHRLLGEGGEHLLNELRGSHSKSFLQGKEGPCCCLINKSAALETGEQQIRMFPRQNPGNRRRGVAAMCPHVPGPTSGSGHSRNMACTWRPTGRLDTALETLRGVCTSLAREVKAWGALPAVGAA